MFKTILENASEGELVWRFAIKDQNHVIEDINAKIKTDVFENGNISCMICSENICLRVKQSMIFFSFLHKHILVNIIFFR